MSNSKLLQIKITAIDDSDGLITADLETIRNKISVYCSRLLKHKNFTVAITFREKK